MKIAIPKGTEAELNGIPVVFEGNTHVDFPCETVDHAAELCSAGGLKIDLSHTAENGNRVIYGAQGKRVEIEPEKPVKEDVKLAKVEIKAEKAEPKETKPEAKEVPKAKEPATKAKPHK